MHLLFVIGEWLLVLALIGLIGVTGWLVFAVVNLKNGVMRDAKRLYESPVRSGKNLVVAGKGIVQQETVRVKHMAKSVKSAASAVSETAGEVKTLVQAVNVEELKPIISDVQSVLKLMAQASQVVKTASANQSEAH